MPGLSVKVRRVRAACVVEIDGDLSLGPGLAQLVREADEAFRISAPAVLLLDVSRAGSIDSAGLGELVSLYLLAVGKKAAVGLIGSSARTRQLLEITRLDGILPSFPTEADALAAFAPSRP